MSVSEFAQSRAAGTADAPARRPGSDWATARATVGAVLALTVVGAVLRIIVVQQPLFADELSTYWISATHGLGGVMSLMYGTASVKHAEITPPMYFVLAWAAMQLGHAHEFLRLPSLLAGIATVPLVYYLGLRTVGRRAALVACAVTALSPFMVYYSTEARAYAVMMLLVLGSTVAMLIALETGRRAWWLLYALCSAAAFFTHYTCAFVLAAQLAWLLVYHREARRPALLANAGAIVLLLPWVPGLINDYHSPTTTILSALTPFTPRTVLIVLEHCVLGYPYAKLPGLRTLSGGEAVTGLTTLFAWPALALVGAATACGFVGLAGNLRRSRTLTGPWQRVRALPPLLVLVVLLAAATPIGEAVASAVSTHIFGIRNLAASWPPLALCFAALLVAAGPRLAVPAVALALAGFAVAGVSMLSGAHQRPHYQDAAAFVDSHARSGDVVIDATGVLSPGPFTALDLTLKARLPMVRAFAPQERDHPFSLLDPSVSLDAASRRAAGLTGGRIFVVGGEGSDPYLTGAGYRRVALRDYYGLFVALFARASPA